MLAVKAGALQLLLGCCYYGGCCSAAAPGVAERMHVCAGDTAAGCWHLLQAYTLTLAVVAAGDPAAVLVNTVAVAARVAEAVCYPAWRCCHKLLLAHCMPC